MRAILRLSACSFMLVMAANVGTPSVCTAQNADAASQSRWRRFTLIGSAGLLIGGPAKSVAQQFEELGFDDVIPGYGWLPPLAHPVLHDAESSLALTARFAVTRDWALGAGFANSDLGGATGYQADPADPALLGDWIESVWSGKLFWMTAFWLPTDWFRIGAGPGAYFLTSDGLGPKIELTRFGGMLEAGVVSPNLGWVVVDVAVRIHLIPATDVESAAYLSNSRVTLRPEWTHVEIAFGVGLRP